MKHDAESNDGVVEFLRKRDYRLVKVLGQGACGKTVLLSDDVLNEVFVCKKYSPYLESQRQVLYGNFVNEIRLLLKAHHPNIVRVFNYYLYPDQFSGFIVMEYIEGADIETYLRGTPERCSDVFSDAIEGFIYLEKSRILHRDIRPANIMIANDGTTKIIDLGFGKRVAQTKDFNRSVSLNWWCKPPDEFGSGTYDFRTEVYFVGKLFQALIQDNDIQEFKYLNLLGRMCEADPDKRISSFADIGREVRNDLFVDIDFSVEEKTTYRSFVSLLKKTIVKIERGLKYVEDIDKSRANLETAYRNCMLEVDVPDPALVLRCILNGGYYYKKKDFRVEVLRGFVILLKGANYEKRRVIFANLHTTLDSLPRYTEEKSDFDDDIPF